MDRFVTGGANRVAAFVGQPLAFVLAFGVIIVGAGTEPRCRGAAR